MAPLRAEIVAHLAVSIEALRRNTLRTLLATIGIGIGVAAVTAIISINEGARREVLRQIELLGLQNVVLRPRYTDAGGQPIDGGRVSLPAADIERLRSGLTFATAISPLVERTVARAGPLESSDGVVLGVAPDYQRIMDLRASSGRLLSVLDVDRNARVCVIGAGVAAELYGDSGPVGAVMRLMGEPYTVVGVLAARPSVGTTGGTLSPRDLNQAVLVPVTRSTFFGQQPLVTEVWLRMTPDVSPDEGGAVAARAIEALDSSRAPFELLVPRELLSQRLRTRRTFNIVLGSVAALSLLVAGIGIMNMMLANVLERTSEIGLRRTVGATRRSIAVQFLIESVLVAGAGGLAGVVVGSLASTVVSRYAAWPTHVSLWAIAVSLAVACAVGVIFGTVPARRAARLEPVDAVRYE